MEEVRSPSPLRGFRRVATLAILASVSGLLLAVAVAHIARPWYSRWGTSEEERLSPLPGDEIVAQPSTSYTLATTIAVPAADLWPWLVQMGQGRAGFYTHEWIENLLGADIHNSPRIVPEWQQLAVGDRVRLTPDPYLGRPGQFMTVARLEAGRALVFEQILPNGSPSSWALVLQPRGDGTTRLLSRRRGGPPTLFDRVASPGYVYMDRGVLSGVRARAEAAAAR